MSPSRGRFTLNEEIKNDGQIYEVNRKCVNELFNYICMNICDGEEFEIYTCWYGDEGKLGDYFDLKEGQYILIKK